MANTKTKTTKKSHPLTAMGLAPVALVAITVSLALITGCEIIACTKHMAEISNPKLVDCESVETGEPVPCDSDNLAYIIERTQMQTYHEIIVIMLAITMLSAGIDVAYLSLARK